MTELSFVKVIPGHAVEV